MPGAVDLPAWTGALFARGGQGGDPLFFILFFGVVLLIAAVAAYFGYLAEKKRTEALKQVADDLGFDFLPTGPGPLEELEKFHLFSQGRGQRVTNVMRGEANGLEVEIFDYRYTTGGGKSSQTWKQTVICFRLPGAALPAFSLRPESVWHRIGTWFGYQDINFEDFPVFSKNYLLRGPNEAAIRELFTERVLAFYDARPGLSTEGGGDRLVFYRHNKRVNPQAVRSFLEEGFQVLGAFRPPEEPAKER